MQRRHAQGHHDQRRTESRPSFQGGSGQRPQQRPQVTGSDRYLKQNLSEQERTRLSKMPCLDRYERKCTRGPNCVFDHSEAAMQKLTDEFKRKLAAHAGHTGSSAAGPSPNRQQSFRVMSGTSSDQQQQPNLNQQLRMLRRPETRISQFSPDYVDPVEELEQQTRNHVMSLPPDEAGASLVRRIHHR